MRPIFDRHAGDCSIYMSMINNRPEAGVCTCGYGHALIRNCDYSQMYSKERTKWLKDNLQF